MNDIKEYNSGCSAYEVLMLLFDKVVKGELETFHALRAYCAPLPDTPRTEAMLRKAFELQKRLYWGFFRDISPTTHPNIWDKVVVADRKYRFAGDIKRLAMIPDVYMSIIDIHGYTRFCQKHRHNMSMLDLLDRVIQQEIPKIAAGFGVISRRARGDEILLLGGSAAEVFEVVYLTVRRLAKQATSTLGPSGTEEPPSAAPADGLPPFQVSAGVAGGAKYAQLVITRDGDLSGTIVNTAARLQARANRISPESGKILLTGVTLQKLKAQNNSARFEFTHAVDFFDTGMVEFKGVKVPVYDTVFLDREADRLAYHDQMSALYDSIGQGLWTTRIFMDVLDLIARIVTSSGGLVDEFTGKAIEATDSISMIQRITKAQRLYDSGRFEQSVAEFTELADEYCRSTCRDPIVTEYLVKIRENYRMFLGLFTDCLDREIDEHLQTIFLEPSDRNNYRTLGKHHDMFENVRDAARLKVADRRGLWHRIVEDSAVSLDVSIQARK
jgi:class 3 adenylate cyclase